MDDVPRLPRKGSTEALVAEKREQGESTWMNILIVVMALMEDLQSILIHLSNKTVLAEWLVATPFGFTGILTK